MSIRAVVVAGVIIGSFGATGCARKADVTLHQPFAPPAQQTLKLTTDRVYHHVTPDHDACVLEFCLPGALNGPRAFVMYIRAPQLRGRMAVEPEDPTAVHGFFVQELGRLAGRTNLIGGTVRFKEIPLAPAWRNVDLDVQCEDGTTLRGRACAEVRPADVRAFERQYAADIAPLTPDGAESTGTTTGVRNTGGP